MALGRPVFGLLILSSYTTMLQPQGWVSMTNYGLDEIMVASQTHARDVE